MSFLLDHTLLQRLADINGLPCVEQRHGVLRVVQRVAGEPRRQYYDAAHVLGVENPDYLYARCTIGQWLPAEGVLAVFSGSTVPHSRYVRERSRVVASA